MTNNLVLLFGATGRTGYHIANFLIEAQIPVRIVVRSKESISKLFKQKEAVFESIVQCKDLTSKQGAEIAQKALTNDSKYGKVNIVISALGQNSSSSNIQQIEFGFHKKLIGFCQEQKIQRFLYVSSAYMTRPWSVICIILNILVKNVMYHKARTENLLRTSGLEYTIIRPTGLIGNYNDKPSACEIGQGDKLGGRIHRATVAKLLVDSINTKMASKITFQCTSQKNQFTQEFNIQKQKLQVLVQDDQSSIVSNSHAKNASIVKFSLLGLVIFMLAKYLQ